MPKSKPYKIGDVFLLPMIGKVILSSNWVEKGTKFPDIEKFEFVRCLSFLVKKGGKK